MCPAVWLWATTEVGSERLARLRRHAVKEILDRRRADRLVDHLPWAALVADGIILNKDGSFQRSFAYCRPDLESATDAELMGTCARSNNVLRRFSSRWAPFFEAERREAQDDPISPFPDAASWLVDRKRKARLLEAGQRFESLYHITLAWMPPPDGTESAAR